MNSSHEFYLSHGSGDEFFEVLNDNDETIRAGEVVSISRGDRVRFKFNALYQSAREYANFGTRYTLEGIAHVDADGFLVLMRGKKHPADGSMIHVYPQGGNSLRFGRTEDYLVSKTFVGPKEDRFSIAGMERFPELRDTEVSWSLTLEDDDDFFARLAEDLSCSSVEARMLLEEWLADRLGEKIYMLVAEYLAEQNQGSIQATVPPALCALSDTAQHVIARMKAAKAARKDAARQGN